MYTLPRVPRRLIWHLHESMGRGAGGLRPLKLLTEHSRTGGSGSQVGYCGTSTRYCTVYPAFACAYVYSTVLYEYDGKHDVYSLYSYDGKYDGMIPYCRGEDPTLMIPHDPTLKRFFNLRGRLPED